MLGYLRASVTRVTLMFIGHRYTYMPYCITILFPLSKLLSSLNNFFMKKRVYVCIYITLLLFTIKKTKTTTLRDKLN